MSERVLPEHHHDHRDVTGGWLRPAVFGVMDGLVSNTALIAGVAGGGAPPRTVALAGLAGLVAGAVSMAAGEYNSVRVQNDLYERELEMERIELHRNPEQETVELAELYESRGVQSDAAQELAEVIMSNPEVALQTHAREELGFDPSSLASPQGAALASIGAFALGAFFPLAPWFVGSGAAATGATLALAVLAALVVGLAIGRFTERSPLRAMLRQLLFTLVPAAITYAIGSLVGISPVS